MTFQKWLRAFYLCVTLMCWTAFAKDKAKPVEQKPTVTVWTAGSIDSAKAMFAPNTNVRVLSAATEKQRELKAGYLPPHERDLLFRKIGIETGVSGMDEFDKDVLMMSAREYTLRELVSDFPMLSEAQLKRLRDEMRKVK